MKLSTTCTTLLLASASAFTPSQKPAYSTSLQAQSDVSRTDFLAQMAGVVAVASAFPGTANAAKYGAIGASSPGVLDPKDAIVDSEILASSVVQDALKSVKDYLALVGEMKKAVAGNDQVNLGPVLRKQFDFGKLRADLNTLNTAFDEDTQRGTDRLIRGILQDLTEIETANAQKEGIERSSRRVATLNTKLDKVENAFNQYLAFVP
mmetsp:Transcript_34675/g.84105  ORF Transcript_34675/g.84105 Transcript_34675/m.84105 type:complete len:207 (-) Transcript_34675:31-651(-)